MKRLKRSQQDLQVIILSGYDFAEYDSPEHLAKADCAFACLVKPCDLESLEATMKRPSIMPFKHLPAASFDSRLEPLGGVAAELIPSVTYLESLPWV